VQRIDPSVVLAIAASGGALAVVRPLHVLVVAVVLVFLVRLRGSRASPTAPVLFLAFLLGALSAYRVHRAIVRDAHDADRTASFVPRPERCAIEGTVVSMPAVRSVLSADVLVETIDCDSRAPPLAGVRVRVYDLHDGAARGDRVGLIAQLAPSRRVQNPELGDPRPVWARRAHVLSGAAIAIDVRSRGRGVLAALDRTRSSLRLGITAAVPGELQPIARAIVLGEEDLSEADDEAFRRSGLTHLLAVSGSHVALVVGGLVALLRGSLLRIPYLARRYEVSHIAAALGVPLAAAYEQLAGDSGSARRATVMAILILIVRAAGRRPHLARTLGVSVLAALAIDPLAPFDLSFVLSIAATLGLVAIGPFLDRPAARVRIVPTFVRRAITATLAASIACAPLIAGISGAVPLLGLVANVFAVPIGELAALPLCNTAAVLGAFSNGPLTRAVGDATSGSLVLLRGVARVAAAPDSAIVTVPPPTSAQLAVLVMLVGGLYVTTRRVRWSVAAVSVAALLLLEITHVRAAQPRGLLRVTVLDIGQGDATLIDLPDGSAMLIDAGGEVGSSWDPGRAVVAPVLAARRRRTLAIAALSHPHPDHFLGLPRALARASPLTFWHNGQVHEGEGTLGSLVASLRARGVRVAGPSTLCGTHAIGGATLEVLHPCPGPNPDHGANDNSLVLRITHGRRKVLLVGDAEHEAEDALLAHPEKLAADLLKVGHHGSRTSSSAAFLAAVAPSIATISCGARNRFGHPHIAALTSLQASGARILRTDLEGSIRFTTDGEHIGIVTAREGW
jgi:competence protein ComEC